MKIDEFITSLDGLKPDTVYAHPDKPDKWFRIDNMRKGDGYVIGAGLGLFSFFTKGNRVRTWRTFDGAVRFIKRQTVKGARYHYYFGHFHCPEEERRAEERRHQKDADHAKRVEHAKAVIRERERAMSLLKQALTNYGFNVVASSHSLSLKHEGHEFEVIWLR